MEAGRPPRLIPGTALRSIDDPAHCLSRLVCGAGGPKIPPAVLAFQNRMRERQRILDGEELKCKLARAADERSLLEDKVCEQQQRKRKLAGDVDSDGSSTDNSPTACLSKQCRFGDSHELLPRRQTQGLIASATPLNTGKL